jgi:predicted phage terminase large subunit-like protein
MQSDFCVGQVWGRKGANIYLLDQVRGRWDFDETVTQIKELSEKWPLTHAKIVEAQSIGAGLSVHLKNLGIPGVIPLPAVGKKEMRALSITPYFQARNVYLPSPETKLWMRDYLNELLNFPNVINDDCVDATSQAIDRLQNTLYDQASEIITDTAEGVIHPEDDYRVGWIPARGNELGVLVVYNLDHGSIVLFERKKYATMQEQIDRAFLISQKYNEAAVWAHAGIDEALLKVLIQRGAPVKRVDMNEQNWIAAYENLSLLISYKQIKLPNDPELLAELEVFKSEARLDGKPDYSYQAGQNSAVRALCLVTYNIHPDIEAKTHDFDWDEVYSVLRHGDDDEGDYYDDYDDDEFGY